MIKYILFDFDGTVINTNDIILDALNYAVEKATGEKSHIDKINEALGHILIEQMKILTPDHPELTANFYKTYYREDMDEMTTLFPGVIETMKGLESRGIRNAVVSNKGINGINHGLHKFNLSSYFDMIISAYDVENPKPHPEAAYKVLHKFNALPSEALLIGDSPHDIMCGKNAGIKTVLVDWTIYPRDGFISCRPDYIIKSFREILKIVDSQLTL